MPIVRRRDRFRNGLGLLLGGVPALLIGAGCACSEQGRPDPLTNSPFDDARRFVGGSFGVPSADAGGVATGGAAGAGQTGGGAGGAAAGGAGGSAGEYATSGAGGAAAGTRPAPVIQHKIYEATCDPSLIVQWGFVTFEATTPGDAQIDFRVRSATSEAELPGATFIELLSASSALGTTRCGLTGPAPACPIDLFERLSGAPLVHLPFMEVEVALHPASGGEGLPEVSAWRMDYSCTQGQ